MEFPLFEIEIKPREISDGKFKARCNIMEHRGNETHMIISGWELSKEYESEEVANMHMKFNAIQYLKRERPDLDLNKVEITISKVK